MSSSRRMSSRSFGVNGPGVWFRKLFGHDWWSSGHSERDAVAALTVLQGSIPHGCRLCRAACRAEGRTMGGSHWVILTSPNSRPSSRRGAFGRD